MIAYMAQASVAQTSRDGAICLLGLARQAFTCLCQPLDAATPRIAKHSLVSNKPLDNRSIAPQAKHDVDVLRVTQRAAVRDVFSLIDSDRDRYLATGAPVHCCIALSVGDASLQLAHRRQRS